MYPAADLWAGQAPALPRCTTLALHLELEAAAALKPEQVKHSLFPGGKRCAFTYKGARQPGTITAFTEMGFRTTIHASPRSGAAGLRALEKAGAEIAVGGYWGAKGTYSSMIGANTVQEAYDAITTSRLALRKKCSGPLACSAVGGHINIATFPFNRNVESGGGFGAAIVDSNFLQSNESGQGGPYAIFLGRHRTHPDWRVTARRRFSNVFGDSRKVPNEKVYYQMLAHQFLGTLNQVEPGQIIEYSLRDFKPKDIRSIRRIMGKYGKHPLIWHATEGMIASYEYQKKKVHVRAVRPAGAAGLDLVLGLEEDIYPPFLLAPLSLQLPGDVRVKSARVGNTACAVTRADDRVHVTVPLGSALRENLSMSLAQPAPDMTIPDRMPVTLTIRNRSDAPLENARLRWVGSPGVNGGPGLSVEGGEKPFRIDPKGERKITATVRTAPGAPWGIAPVIAILTAKVKGQDRVYSEGLEVVVAPMLSVDVCPYNQVALRKGRFQHLIVTLDNTTGANKFLSHRAGPCKGTVSFNLPDGLTVAPAEQAFELRANDRKTLVFKLTNNDWSDKDVRVPPVIRLDGHKAPIEITYPGTKIIRNQAVIDYRPLDDQGLLAYASWDDKKFCGFDKAVGKRGVGHGGLSSKIGVNWTPMAGGAKGWCIGAQSAILADSFNNVDYKRGTILCWIRRDLRIRNENQYKGDPASTWKMGAVHFANNRGETIWVVQSVGQHIPRSQSGLTLRRYYGWGGKEGYLEVIWQGLHRQLRYAQAPYENARLLEWRHVAVVWDIEQKRLELFVDGRLLGKAKPGDDDWYGVPWDNGTPSRGGRASGIQALSMDHGKMTWTMRDEFYIYNRPFTPAEVRANMTLAKQAK